MVDIEAEMRSREEVKMPYDPISLKFEDIVYKVKVYKQQGLLKKKKVEEKVILKGISGVVGPGEMLAMLGPSGSGKSTLLAALGGRLISGCLEGSVRYNGRRNVMRQSIGYVAQEDILYEHLTVSETLVYTALLKLPNSFTKNEKVAQAEAVIVKLGLSGCKDSVIGGYLVRGISGGERKRVSIGQEMLTNPSLLLLDEPTSGLDSTTAQKMVSTVVNNVIGGTVVMTIHQPSSRLFYLFNKVLLLSDGNPFYFGRGDGVMDYFTRIVGFSPSFAMNPADFLLDLANGVCTEDDHESEICDQIKKKLLLSYKEHLDENVKSEMMREEQNQNQNQNPKENQKNEWVTTWWQQFCVLLKRDLKERKHESLSPLNIIQVLIIAILTGFLWFKSNKAHLQDQVGLLFFYAVFWAYFPLYQALFSFPADRLILSKERSSGMYRLSSYFMARILADLPMDLLLPTAFLIIVYWMTGLKPTASAFFYNLLALLLNVLVSQGLGLALGALFLDQKKATVLASMLMLAFMLAGGFFVQHVPDFIAWIKYLSLIQYAFTLLLNSQYANGDTYPCSHANATAPCFVDDFPLVKAVALNGHATPPLILILMLIAYRLIAYIALRRIPTN